MGLKPNIWKVIGAETEYMKIIVPDIKVEDFNFSTLSDAI